MINPGSIPFGFANESLQHSRKTHRIDIPNDSSDESNYTAILESILEFIGARDLKKDKIPPIFTGLLPDEVLATILTLDFLCDVAGYDASPFTVYPVDLFFFKLQRKCIEIQKSLSIAQSSPLASIIFARNCLERDDAFYYSSIGCKYHNEIDNPNTCCLSKVKRWGYTIAKHCFDDRFEPISGAHCPDDYCKLNGPIEKMQSLSSVTEDFRSLRVRNSKVRAEIQKSPPKPAKPSKYPSFMSTTTQIKATSSIWFQKFLEGSGYESSKQNTPKPTDSESTLATQQ